MTTASEDPVSRVNCGVPLTVTASVNVTVIAATSPTLRVPSEVVEVTLETVGTTPSITKALLAPREPEAPGDAKVSVAALPAKSLIVPLLSANALVLA